ncbi:aldo/keto reductase [Snodgrassella sp. CFCC 13594]|uniref:aldo/keto reductase n=1 Tax=Snodgrassella sp. CFCC 13594 TaxID=1775559 RepID=UPI00082D769F|nr:aldo/keto reductase [Snodgrassella sp. CFCC 13594]
MSAIPMLSLRKDFALPAIGFGTYRVNGVDGVAEIKAAIDHGFRLIDSAFNYENEGTVGMAVRHASVIRDELTVTSKLPGRHHHYNEALDTIAESVYRMGLDEIDVYLIHWPNPKQGLFVEAWQALIEAQKRGWVKHIGVSNFLPEHIDTLVAETGVWPVLNQIELHPYFQQTKQLAYHQQHHIITEAWSPLGRGAVLQEPMIQALAQKYSVSSGQIILRWCVQRGIIPIPKSTSAQRQQQNLNLWGFSLSPDDMAKIATLDKPEGRINQQDPAVYEEF